MTVSRPKLPCSPLLSMAGLHAQTQCVQEMRQSGFLDVSRGWMGVWPLWGAGLHDSRACVACGVPPVQYPSPACAPASATCAVHAVVGGDWRDELTQAPMSVHQRVALCSFRVHLILTECVRRAEFVLASWLSWEFGANACSLVFCSDISPLWWGGACIVCTFMAFPRMALEPTDLTSNV